MIHIKLYHIIDELLNPDSSTSLNLANVYAKYDDKTAKGKNIKYHKIYDLINNKFDLYYSFYKEK